MNAVPRVLILDGHSPAATEAAQSLGRCGLPVDVACQDSDCSAFHSRYVRDRLRQPPLVPLAAAKAWLRGLCRGERYGLVVPTTDASIMLMRSLAPGEPARARAALPSDEALDVAVDKEAARRFAAGLGLRVPESLVLARGSPVPPCERFPVVLKSLRSRVVVDGENRRLNTELARDAAGREQLLAEWLPHTAVQQQQFVAGHGYGIEMLFERGRAAWHFAHERLHELPLSGGASAYRRSIAPPAELLAAAERLLAALAWHGVAMVEFRGDARRGWYFMEINPRLWGSLALSIDCGVDFPWGLARLARRAPLPPQPAYRVGYYARQLLYDVGWQKENLRADHADPLLLTRPRLASVLGLLRPLIGRESWDHFDWTDLGVTAHLLRRVLAQEAARLAPRLAAPLQRRRALARHRRLQRTLRRAGRPVRLLFLCHGNVCRSALAGALARAHLRDVEVLSAGFHEVEGRATPASLQRAAAALGVDLSAHRSRRVRSGEVASADLILCMDAENVAALQRLFPQAIARATLLGLFASPPVFEIADPYGRPDWAARGVAAVVRDALAGLERWLQESFRAPARKPVVAAAPSVERPVS